MDPMCGSTAGRWEPAGKRTVQPHQSLHRRVEQDQPLQAATHFFPRQSQHSLRLQVKLLRVLQSRGSSAWESKSIRVDVRVIAATGNRSKTPSSRPLPARTCTTGNVWPIMLPPLRSPRGHSKRRSVLERILKENQIPPLELPQEIMTSLQVHDWPGNVRELENYVERWCCSLAGR